MSDLVSDSPTRDDAEIQVPLPQVARFVRQLSHDLRNHLNAAELQAAYIAEIAENAEVKAEISRLRGMVSGLGAALQNVTTSLAAIKLTQMTYSAADLVEDLQSKLASELPDEKANVEWNVNLEMGTNLNIDPQLLEQALLELFRNAFQHDRAEGKISVTASADEKEFSLVLRETKNAFDRSTERWGREPFQTVGHGHYGLGLQRTRSILEAHQGQLSARYEAPSLITTVSLPVV